MGGEVSGSGRKRRNRKLMAVEYRCCEVDFFVHILIIVGLVLFAGLMSGLTLGLMSMSLVDLEVLAKSGTPRDRKHAGNLPFYLYFIVFLLVFLRAFLLHTCFSAGYVY